MTHQRRHYIHVSEQAQGMKLGHNHGLQVIVLGHDDQSHHVLQVMISVQCHEGGLLLQDILLG